jgi:hypothetical protein
MGFLRRIVAGGSTPAAAKPAEPEVAPAPAPAERRYASTACPYCGVALESLPKAKKKCPACGQPIWVRAGPDGFTYLLQDGDRPVLERAWAEYRAEETWTKKALGFVDEAGLAAARRNLEAHGSGYTARDVYWSVARLAALEAIRQGDWRAAHDAYLSMAWAAYEESDQDDAPRRALDLMREANLAMLREYLRDEATADRVEILGCGCDACKVGGSGAILMRDELTRPRIPHAGCAEGFCTCSYAAVVDYEELRAMVRALGLDK